MTEVTLEFVQPSEETRPVRTLILDADETLVHSYEPPTFLDKYRIYSDPQLCRQFHPVDFPPICYSMFLDVKSDSTPKRIWGLHRPYQKEFLSFALDYFDNLCLWSAGADLYVHELNKEIFMESGLTPPKIVWARSKCPRYQDMYHKPIYDMIEYVSEQPHSIIKIDPAWTLIVDDKNHTFMQNPSSGVLIPPYSPGEDRPGKVPTLEDLLNRSDRALLQLQTWLERPEVRSAPDIRSLDKSQIFLN